LSYIATKNALASFNSYRAAFKIRATDTVGDIPDFADTIIAMTLPFLITDPSYPGEFLPSRILMYARDAVNPLFTQPTPYTGVWIIEFCGVASGAGFGGNPAQHEVVTGVARDSWLDFSIEVSPAGLVTIVANGSTYTNNYGIATPALYSTEISVLRTDMFEGGVGAPIGSGDETHTVGPVVMDILSLGALTGNPL
jgi:hypothetical protein